MVCAERARCGCHTGFLARTVDGQGDQLLLRSFDLSVVTPRKSSVSRSASSHQPPATTVNRYLLTNTNERRYRGVEDEDDEQRGVLLAACSCSLLEQRASESYHPFERYRYRTQCNGNGGSKIYQFQIIVHDVIPSTPPHGGARALRLASVHVIISRRLFIWTSFYSRIHCTIWCNHECRSFHSWSFFERYRHPY